MKMPLKPGACRHAPVVPLPGAAWRHATAQELAWSPGLLAYTVWRELIRLLPEVHLAPRMGDLAAFGSVIVPEPEVVDGLGPRPALIDTDGRRWLLDGSGEVA